MIRGAEVACTEAFAAGLLKPMGHFLGQMFVFAQEQMDMVEHSESLMIPTFLRFYSRD
jgi:hypothetical protein